MNLVHFYRTYYTILANPIIFFSLIERIYKYSNLLSNKGYYIDSIIKQHFVNINVS